VNAQRQPDRPTPRQFPENPQRISRPAIVRAQAWHALPRLNARNTPPYAADSHGRKCAPVTYIGLRPRTLAQGPFGGSWRSTSCSLRCTSRLRGCFGAKLTRRILMGPRALASAKRSLAREPRGADVQTTITIGLLRRSGCGGSLTKSHKR